MRMGVSEGGGDAETRARVRGKDVGRDGRSEERVGEEENTRTRDVCDG